MKKLKITSKNQVRDKVTGEYLAPGTEFERTNERAQDFLNAKVAVEVDGDKAKTLDELSSDVSKVKSVDELNAMADAEKAGEDRKGAYELFDKRRAELEAEAEKKTASKKK